MRRSVRNSIKTKGTITAIALVFLSCFVALLFASTVFFAVVSRGIFPGHSIESMLIFFVITLVLCVGLCSILLPKALNRITDPLIELSESSKKVAHGDFSVRVKKRENDELGELADNFNRMVDELSKMEYLRKDFMSSVSHEFKTPLASIQGFSELLSDANVSKQDKMEYSRLLREETTRLSRLCSNMLSMSRLDSEVRVGDATEFFVDEQIRKVIVLLEERWREKSIEFEVALAKIPYCGNEELLHQVWLNLIENAIKFSNQQEVVIVSYIQKDVGVEVSVTNQGAPLSTEQQARIFERFYQADPSHNEQGSGLGLSIVARIIDLIGGEVMCESDSSGKTTFRVFLP